jgi:hypothetical protein
VLRRPSVVLLELPVYLLVLLAHLPAEHAASISMVPCSQMSSRRVAIASRSFIRLCQSAE